jgi:hypothetical protein
MTPTPITLKDAIDAPEGTTIYEYTVEMSREIRYREKDHILVRTATPPERLKERWDEAWQMVSDREMLSEDELTWREDDHKEVIVAQTTTVKRCTRTKEMEF